jgi:hypothetical protein
VIGGTHGTGGNLPSQAKARLPLKKTGPSPENGNPRSAGGDPKGNGKGSKPVPNKGMRPEQVIPFGDGDFKEF